jgi:chemotaxis regulatin CheY-phosphate phosphatase CheZ
LQSGDIDPRDAQIAYAAVIEDPAKRIETLLKLFEKSDKARAYYMRQCDQYVDHIAGLEELLEEWKKFGTSELDCKHPDELVHLTEQLLGEEDSAHE